MAYARCNGGSKAPALTSQCGLIAAVVSSSVLVLTGRLMLERINAFVECVLDVVALKSVFAPVLPMKLRGKSGDQKRECSRKESTMLPAAKDHVEYSLFLNRVAVLVKSSRA